MFVIVHDLNMKSVGSWREVQVIMNNEEQQPQKLTKMIVVLSPAHNKSLTSNTTSISRTIEQKLKIVSIMIDC